MQSSPAWQKARLQEVLLFSNGKSSPPREGGGTFSVYGSNGIIGCSSRKNADGGTIVVGRVGSFCGSLRYSVSQCWVTDNAIMGNAKGDNNPRFLYYLLQSLDLGRLRGGSGQPLLNQGVLNAVTADIPPKSEQDRIAGLLSSLDDRIDSLHTVNGGVEAIAQAIFKSWFVDFDPVRAKAEGREPEGVDVATAALFPSTFEVTDGRTVPSGWKIEQFDKVATFLNGLALQKFPAILGEKTLPAIKIAQLRARSVEGADPVSRTLPKAYVVKDGDLLFSWSGSLEVDFWCNGEGALNQHLFKVSSDHFPRSFYYSWLITHLPWFRTIAASKATTMGHIQRRHLSEAKVVVPSPEVLELSAQIMEPLIDRSILARLQQRTLAELRDALLPRLISGKLRLPEAEKLVASAL